MVKFTDDWSLAGKNLWYLSYANPFSINDLENGDSMTISIVHIPSGQTIFSKNVVVS